MHNFEPQKVDCVLRSTARKQNKKWRVAWSSIWGCVNMVLLLAIESNLKVLEWMTRGWLVDGKKRNILHTIFHQWHGSMLQQTWRVNELPTHWHFELTTTVLASVGHWGLRFAWSDPHLQRGSAAFEELFGSRGKGETAALSSAAERGQDVSYQASRLWLPWKTCMLGLLL